MNKFKKFIASFSSGIFVFIFSLLISFIVYLYVNRNEPIFYRVQNEMNHNDYADYFIQNPFRDKTKELVADTFLNSIKGKTVIQSLDENKDIAFNTSNGWEETGKLVEWSLWNRFDNENETKFYYAIYREDELSKPKRGKYLLSFVILKLNKENSEWRVKEYTCQGTSNNS